ncbi:MAG: DUF3667 domain-containing protein [Cephaloticoccus sp.]|nr:DUF3667 domain-containing protein [Cephaloticoccus sp.]MCF7760567.1 DUF3667 domain-containing protein [Cephaloticoccus sp.]
MPLDSDLPDIFSVPSPSLTSAVGLDAVGAQVTERSGHHHPQHSHCENCGTALQGPYCHHCGQHDFDINRSFWHTFLEALENFFHFDTKLFRNLITLLFRPGRMTAEFNAGKRVSQVPPFRLYVFVSILFFFLTFLGKEKDGPIFNTSTSNGPHAGFTVDGKPVDVDEAWNTVLKNNEANPAVQQVLENARAKAGPLTQQIKEEIAADLAEEKTVGSREKSAFAQKMEAKGEKLTSAEGQKQMLHSFLGAVPKLILLCLPLFALFTRFLFRKSRLVYLQHLVLALHFHTFVYLWLMARDGWVFLTTFPSPQLAGYVALACNLWLVVYPFQMLRYMFANSWPRTVFKTLVLGLVYFFTLAMGFVVTAALLLLAL